MLLNTSIIAFILAFISATDTFANQAKIMQSHCRTLCTKASCKSPKQLDTCKQLCDAQLIPECLTNAGDAHTPPPAKSAQTPSSPDMQSWLNDAFTNMAAMRDILRNRVFAVHLLQYDVLHYKYRKIKQRMTKSDNDIFDKMSEMERMYLSNPASRGKERADQVAKSLLSVNTTTCEYVLQQVEGYIQEFPATISNSFNKPNGTQKERPGVFGFIKKQLSRSERRQAKMSPNQEEQKPNIEPTIKKLQSFISIGNELQGLATELDKKCKLAKTHESNQESPWTLFMMKDMVLVEAEQINQLSSKAENLRALSLQQ
jgi:hypothetical protein